MAAMVQMVQIGAGCLKRKAHADKASLPITTTTQVLRADISPTEAARETQTGFPVLQNVRLHVRRRAVETTAFAVCPRRPGLAEVTSRPIISIKTNRAANGSIMADAKGTKTGFRPFKSVKLSAKTAATFAVCQKMKVRVPPTLSLTTSTVPEEPARGSSMADVRGTEIGSALRKSAKLPVSKTLQISASCLRTPGHVVDLSRGIFSIVGMVSASFSNTEAVEGTITTLTDRRSVRDRVHPNQTTESRDQNAMITRNSCNVVLHVPKHVLICTETFPALLNVSRAVSA